jgi:biotin carboxyl carrier protein
VKLQPGRFTVRQDEGTASVVEVLADGRLRVGDGADAFTVTADGDGRYVVYDGHRAWRVAIADLPDESHVWSEGRIARLDIEREGAAVRRPRSRRGHGETSAPMPGTVIAIAVSPGQQVAAGDLLLTLEAMKMELPIRSPRDGVVSAVRCREGELVQPGTPLVEFA